MTEDRTRECIIIVHNILKKATDLVRAISLGDESYVFSNIDEIQRNCVLLQKEYIYAHNNIKEI